MLHHYLCAAKRLVDPLAHTGQLTFRANVDDAITRDFAVSLARIQLEQDTGKAYFHDKGASPLIDLNRCGVALIEIVTRPDMHSAAEAVAFVKKLRSILRAINVCNGNMEEVSVSELGCFILTRGNRAICAQTSMLMWSTRAEACL